jgi:hypothetical protein
MKTTEHTPGPWEIVNQPFLGQDATMVDGICLVFGKGKIPDANARLIAAAPDLLAALESICAAPANTQRVLTIAGAAIAKARGQV